ncbi:hypothetical protein CR513_11371, partial [Mucuna pruriens]
MCNRESSSLEPTRKRSYSIHLRIHHMKRVNRNSLGSINGVGNLITQAQLLALQKHWLLKGKWMSSRSTKLYYTRKPFTQHGGTRSFSKVCVSIEEVKDQDLESWKLSEVITRYSRRTSVDKNVNIWPSLVHHYRPSKVIVVEGGLSRELLSHCMLLIMMKNQNDELNTWRVCIDYKKLNQATHKDHFPLPFLDHILEKLPGKSHYYFLDGYFEYMQIRIAPEDQYKITFTCPFDTFAYTRMPFGLYNAPSTF